MKYEIQRTHEAGRDADTGHIVFETCTEVTCPLQHRLRRSSVETAQIALKPSMKQRRQSVNKSGYPAPKEVIRLMARKTASQQSRERLKVWLLTINEHESVVDKEISRLIRLQSALHRMYLQACNGPEWNETDKQYVKMLEDNIRGLVAGFRLAVEFNSDPRGNPVFIFEEGHVEGDRLPCNDMGGRGWAIW